MSETFRIVVPHDEAEDYHAWYFPGAWPGERVVTRRDGRGYAQGARDGSLPHWFILRCNNTDCPGEAAVPVAVVLDLANSADPAAHRRGHR